MAEYNFNPGAHNPRFGGGDSLGVGKHPVVGSSVELKDAKNNSGNGYLALKVTAIDGPEKGSSTTIRFNLHNHSADAVRIAEQQLAAVCVVMGITGPWSNTDILLNKPFVIDNKMQAGSDKYTEVVEVFTMDGKTVSEAMKSGGGAGNGGGGGFSGFGGSNQQGNNGNTGASGGGWGGGTAAQEQKPQENQQQGGGSGWGAGAGAGGGGSSGGGWQQNSGGGGGSGWGQSA